MINLLLFFRFLLFYWNRFWEDGCALVGCLQVSHFDEVDYKQTNDVVCPDNDDVVDVQVSKIGND